MRYDYYGLFDPRNDIILQNLYDYGWFKKFVYDTSSIPLWGDVARSYDAAHAISDYMSPRGITWDDVKYPTRVQGSGSTGQVINRFINQGWSVSSNIADLYK